MNYISRKLIISICVCAISSAASVSFAQTPPPKLNFNPKDPSKALITKSADQSKLIDEQCRNWQAAREKKCNEHFVKVFVVMRKQEEEKRKTGKPSKLSYTIPTGCRLDYAKKTITCEDAAPGATGSKDKYDFTCDDRGFLSNDDRISPFYRVDANSAQTGKAKGYCVEDDRVRKQLGAACAQSDNGKPRFGSGTNPYSGRDCANGVVEIYGTITLDKSRSGS